MRGFLQPLITENKRKAVQTGETHFLDHGVILRRFLVVGGVVLGTVGAAFAQRAQEMPSADKSEYHLFNPTPRELWRLLSADRPDLTESPYTVDAGAVQLEMSFVEFAFDDTRSGTSTELSIAPTILKLGLTNNTDIQFTCNPFVRDDPVGGST